MSIIAVSDKMRYQSLFHVVISLWCIMICICCINKYITW